MTGGIDKVFPADSELFRSSRHGSFSIWLLPVWSRLMHGSFIPLILVVLFFGVMLRSNTRKIIE